MNGKAVGRCHELRGGRQGRASYLPALARRRTRRAARDTIDAVTDGDGNCGCRVAAPATGAVAAGGSVATSSTPLISSANPAGGSGSTFRACWSARRSVARGGRCALLSDSPMRLAPCRVDSSPRLARASRRRRLVPAADATCARAVSFHGHRVVLAFPDARPALTVGLQAFGWARPFGGRGKAGVSWWEDEGEGRGKGKGVGGGKGEGKGCVTEQVRSARLGRGGMCFQALPKAAAGSGKQASAEA